MTERFKKGQRNLDSREQKRRTKAGFPVCWCTACGEPLSVSRVTTPEPGPEAKWWVSPCKCTVVRSSLEADLAKVSGILGDFYARYPELKAYFDRCRGVV